MNGLFDDKLFKRNSSLNDNSECGSFIYHPLVLLASKLSFLLWFKISEGNLTSLCENIFSFSFSVSD